jgi:hypothetical protein
MKLFLTLFFSAWQSLLPAQNISLQLGHSLMPADHVSLRYEHWTNSAINFSLAGFYERSHDQLLDYKCYGADLLGEYVSCRGADPLPWFSWRFGLGATIQNENEPWLYKDISFSQRINYGLLSEASLDYNISETFRLSLFGQQKFLLRRMLGATQFCFGLGLGYHFPQY